MYAFMPGYSIHIIYTKLWFSLLQFIKIYGENK